MALRRGLLAALVMGPMAMVCSEGHAQAADPGRAPRLPDGVHMTAHGRYVHDIGNHHAKRHPLSFMLLPETWQPGDDLLPHPHGGSSSGGGGGSVGTASGMAPADIVGAYKIPSTAKANGAIVAILDSPDSAAFADLTAYRANYGLTALAKCASGTHGGVGKTPCFSQVSEDGSASGGTDSGTSDGETSLDMDMISGACPDCSILLVELGTLSDTDIQTGVTTAITLGATATSISLGGPETQGGGDPTGSYTTAGHLVLAASGDFAYDLDNEQGGGSGASYPASAPDILAVGGTELFLKSGAVGTGTYGEGVWNDGNFGTSSTDQDVTTSGCSQEFTMPTWQATPTASACGTYRATADLSAAATYYGGGKETDIAVYCTAFETAGYTAWLPVEGTSASSPLVAALLTRVGMAVPISNSIATLYASSTVAAFNDVGNATTYPIPSGGSDTDSNASCTPTSLCTVGTGWDGPSGVGTPNGTKLAALGASSGSSSGSSSGGSNDDAGSEDAGGSSSGSSSGGGLGSGSGSSSGGGSSGTSSGSPISEDSGTPAGSGSGGSSNDGGNGFEPGGGSSSGCNTTSGSSPMEGTGMIALLVGGMALLGSRRRGVKK